MSWKLDQWGSIVDESGNTIKIVGVALPGGTNKEAIKNRNLLLAAPDLLEALQEINRVMNWIHRNSDSPKSGMDHLLDRAEMVEQAIAKALGESDE